MSRRIFVNVSRGMTDKTAVCVFPWEKLLLEHIHGDGAQEVSIDEMCSMDGAVKVERVKLPNIGLEATDPPRERAPDMRAQLEAMATVDRDADPSQDPEAEYNRMVEKYGMDKEVPLPVVAMVFGKFATGAFAAAMREGGKDPAAMSITELRSELKRQGIDFDRTATKAELQDKLETATA